MADQPATVPFRQELRRAQSKFTPDGHHEHHPDETTPLIGNGSASNGAGLGDAAPNGHGHGHPSWAREFFFDTRKTPGLDHHNPFVKCPSHVWHVTKVTLLSNYVNLFLVMVPIGIVAGEMGWSPTAVFTINFFAIIPLAAVLSFATEEISMKLGDTLGGLLNATFGNAVELIVSIVALRDGQIEVVQSSMLGSILSNLLLVMGMCFLFGGIANMRNADGVPAEQKFSSATAQTTCSLMALASASMIIPATLYAVLDQDDNTDTKQNKETILTLSRGTSIILLLMYILYLFFQLRTHKNLFDAEAPAASTATSPTATDADDDGEPRPELAPAAAGHGEEPALGPISAVLVLVVTTVLVSVCADYLVGSIDAIVESAHISKNFIGLILIPIVGNAAEHVTAVVVAIRNKMDLAMGVAIGSSIQIALLVTPFLVLLGWIVLDQPMSLQFESFETVAFAVSVLLVTYTVQDGKSNYLEGAMLLGLYVIIALAFWASPSDTLNKSLHLLGIN